MCVCVCVCVFAFGMKLGPGPRNQVAFLISKLGYFFTSINFRAVSLKFSVGYRRQYEPAGQIFTSVRVELEWSKTASKSAA